MIKSLLTPCWLLAVMTMTVRAADLGDYLPKQTSYDQQITTPKEYLGFEIGDRHLQHHQLVGYLRTLAKESSRITLREYARSYGDRPLVLLTITSPENHQRLEDIRSSHLQLAHAERASDVDTETLPAVIFMGYNVHGNEASAGNAAPLVAYHLAAAMGAGMDQLLRETVVLLDPCLNPDGFERFAHWVNSHRGQQANPDPSHREHNELFPSGRTNYYWFDLNRDWLPAQHPESQGRLAIYHRWLPNVVLDYHEMGSDATYFFQPGIPARNNPLTPRRNFQLTQRFAEYHARALDSIGSLYFTEERFDDFYMGKGSTYPDLHGGVGILFEQGSARGHVQETTNGMLTFPFAIRNQFTTSLSSLEATRESRLDLLEFKREFYRDAVSLARNSKHQGYLVSSQGDQERLRRFLEILRRHRIEAFELARDLDVEGRRWKQGTAYVIPVQQPEYRFLTSLFERRTQFQENIFYDVSTWTLPLAFGLEVAQLGGPIAEGTLGKPASQDAVEGVEIETEEDSYAYLLEWSGYFAPRALYRLMDANLKVKVAQSRFQIQHQGQPREMNHGTILIPVGIQSDRRDTIRQIVQTIRSQDRVDVFPTSSGLTRQGIDLGSSRFATLTKPRILLVVGVGASSYETGEIWHLLDRRFQIPVTLVDTHRLRQVDLSKYSTLVMASGTYSLVSPDAVDRVKDWLRQGGTLITIGSAASWADSSSIVSLEFRSRQDSDGEPLNGGANRRPYAEASTDAALRLVKGAIFRTLVDRTHPVGYGYQTPSLPVFRSQGFFLEPSTNAYSTPVAYSPQPLISGYISAENLQLARGSASVVIKPLGRGRVIVMVDNPNFRAFWYGTNRLFLNSVFFGSIIRVP